MVCLLQDSEKRRERRDAEMISSEMKMANKEFIKVSLLKRLYVFFMCLITGFFLPYVILYY